MSSFRRFARTAAFALALAAFFAAAGPTGCGFRPLYGERAGERITVALASIEVLPIDGPLGFDMRNSLLDSLTPQAVAGEARYELAVDVDFRARPEVTEGNTQIRRYLLRMDADYVLRSKADGAQLDRGKAHTETSYNIVTGEDYSTIVARRNAVGEAARDAARQIVSHLAFYFDRQFER